MKAVDLAVALLTAVGLAVTSAEQLRAAEIAVHTGKGTVLFVRGSGDQIQMTDERGGKLVLWLAPQTRVVDETGNPMPVAALRSGDLVREQCVEWENGKLVAKQIRLLRPAWMETGIPSSKGIGGKMLGAGV